MAALFETAAARGLIVFLFFFVFIFGAFVAGSCLHDPDTCWLLAVGHHIVETCQVPRVDPFSYTFPALGPDGAIDYGFFSGAGSGGATAGGGRLFVAYQWLSELIFYLSYLLGAGYGLVGLVAMLLVCSMLLGPLFIFRYLKSPLISGGFLVILAVVASSFHFLARPEVFSYFLLTILLVGLTFYRKDYEEKQEPSRLVFLYPLIMLIWANMHTGFVFGLIVGTVFSAGIGIEAIVRRDPRYGKLLRFTFSSLAAGFAVCCINPYGLALWTYLPGLFFSPINKYIVELKPLGAGDLTQWTYYPFLLVSGILATILGRRLLAWKAAGKAPFSWGFSVLGIAIAIGGAIICRRMIPFCTLYLISEAAWLRRGAAESGRQGFVSGVQSKLLELTSDHLPVSVSVICALLGIYLISSRVMEPTIPQSSISFPAPYKALAHMRENTPPGRMLNDPQIGDMIIWHLNTRVRPLLATDPQRIEPPEQMPRVFIDTRFDMYGAPLVDDYFKMATLSPGWEKIFDRYGFDWVFLLRSTPLSGKLMESHDWQVSYKDDAAVILIRKQIHRKISDDIF